MAPAEYGFLGLGIMGTAMARNLIKAGKTVMVWNRTPSKCEELVREGATAGKSPADVVAQCPITFAMLAQDDVALEVAFGPSGVLESIQSGKAYVDASTVGPDTSKRISEAVTKKGGRYLEAPVSGTKQPAEQGKLVFLTAGDESLFTEIKPALDILGSKSLFLGEVGNGAKMKVTVNMVMGTMLNALSEGLALSEKAGLSQKALLEVLDAGAMSCGLFKTKGAEILSEDYSPSFPLKHHQKDMRLALAVGDEAGQPLPAAAAANETFKLAKSLGFGNEDTAAVYKALHRDRKGKESK